MDDHEKRPYRKLAEICRRDRRPFYLTVEIRVPTAGVAVWRPSCQRSRPNNFEDSEMPQQWLQRKLENRDGGYETKSPVPLWSKAANVVGGGATAIEDVQPDTNFGGYETSTAQSKREL